MSATELARYVSSVLTKVCTSKDTATVTPEREFAVDPADGILKIGRLVPFSVEEELAAAASAMTAVNGASSKDVVASLDIPKPGMLDTLRWTVSPAVAELPETHVEIDVKAVGLNFRVCLRLLRSGSLAALSRGSRSLHISRFLRDPLF